MSTEEAALATRKKRIRAAHHGSVTRLTAPLEDILSSGDSRRMKQLKQSLTNRLHVLSTIDKELISLVSDEQLEEEVEQADLIRERISFALISLDDHFDSLLLKRTSREASRASTPSRSSDAAEGERGLHTPTPDRLVPLTDGSVHPVSLPAATTSSIPTPPRTTYAIMPPPLIPALSSTGTLPSSSSLEVTAVTTPHAPAASVTFSGMPPFTLMSSESPMMATGFSSPPRTVPLDPLPPPFLTLPPVPHSAPPTHGVKLQVKFLKLSIRKFNGDLTKWVTCWDSFSSSIHTNPTLSSVDKFNYLSSLLDSSAAEAIAGLTLTAANYDEAIATLKRFGSPQLIVNRHMEALLNTAAVSSHQDVKGLRKLHDSVEAHIRGLRALGSAYGGMLSSVLVNKLPPEIKLIVSRDIAGGSWDLNEVMRLVEQEVDARERASVPTTNASVRPPRQIPIAVPLVANNPKPRDDQAVCVYCSRDHTSSSCSTTTDVIARREILCKSGRCYTCLKKHHLSKDCRSKLKCGHCRGRYHITICSHNAEQVSSRPNSSPVATTSGRSDGQPSTTNSLYTDSTALII